MRRDDAGTPPARDTDRATHADSCGVGSDPTGVGVRRLCWKQHLLILAILLLALILRTVRLDQSPPGLHPDEASNAWNAWCLLKTGMDEHSVSFPLFYTRTFNDNRTAMLLYVHAPVMAVFGLNVWSIRLPVALFGVAAVGLIYLVLRRFGDPRLAWIAALLLALDPTHLQHTRWGLEAPLGTTLALLSIWLWQRATAATTRRAELRDALIAGLVTAISCYGYAAIRIYLPLMIAALLLILRPNRRTLLIGGATFAILFAPLVYVHLTDPAINARAMATRTWDEGDPPGVIAIKLIERYASHFSPKFLFITGTNDKPLTPPAGFGALPWAWLALGAIGIVAVLRNVVHRPAPAPTPSPLGGEGWGEGVSPEQRTAIHGGSASVERPPHPNPLPNGEREPGAALLARFVVLAIPLYPISDVLNSAGNANVLRVICGWWALDLIAAIGVLWLWQKHRAFGAIALAIGVLNAGLHTKSLLLDYAKDPEIQYRRGVDIEQACDFIKPKLADYDAVVFTTIDATFAYPQTLVAFDYSPEAFLAGPTVRGTASHAGGAEPDLVARYGNVYFNLPLDEIGPMIEEATRTGTKGRSLWVVRPTEAKRIGGKTIHTVRLSDGFASLVIVEKERQ